MRALLSLAAMTVLVGAGCSLFDTGYSGRTTMARPAPAAAPVAPRPRTFEDDSKSIRVTNMAEGQLLTNGFVVEGEAVAFESTISWRLEDGTGQTVAQGFAMAAQPDVGVPGPFRIPIFLDRESAGTEGTLFVFEHSAKDGSEIHVVKVPVTFSKETRDVKVYFGNSKKNPDVMDCALVYPVIRTVPDGSMPYIAVHALLNGPTPEEKAAGYYTSIPNGVILQNTIGADGFAALDFNHALLEGVAGSCRVTAIRSQIETTAAQEGGKILPITVYGKFEEVLQP